MLGLSVAPKCGETAGLGGHLWQNYLVLVVATFDRSSCLEGVVESLNAAEVLEILGHSDGF
jgi:hypothetical protein